MFTKPEDFAKSGFNFALFYANTSFDCIERLALLNLAAARSVFEAAMSNVTTLLGAKDVQAFVAIQKELATPSIEKGMEYSRNVIAIASETKDKIAKEVETQVAETNAKVSGLVEKALESAPAGSEAGVAAATSATLKAANVVAAPKAVAKKAA